MDAFAFHKNPELLESFRIYCTYTNAGAIYDGLLKEIDVVKDCVDSTVNPILGKLSFKEEAAGKVRVFAITDG